MVSLGGYGQPFHRCPQRYGMIYLFDKLELVGARPLHLAAARPFCRLKALLGLSLFCFAPQTRSYLVDAILSVGHDLLRAT